MQKKIKKFLASFLRGGIALQDEIKWCTGD